MAESWVRLWAGMTTDPKWKTIARKSGRPLVEVIAVFTHSMLIANEADERGDLDDWVTEDVASALDMDEEHVEAIFQAMQDRVIVDGRLSGWEKRQPVREDFGNEKTGAMSAAERKRKQRESEKQDHMSRDVTQCHDMSRDVTQCHAPEAEAEAEVEALSGKPDRVNGLRPESREVLSFLNELTGREYESVESNLEMIACRLREGRTVDQLKAMVREKSDQWLTDEKMRQYLRPKTLFNASNCAQYMGEVGSQPKSKSRIEEIYGAVI